MAAKDERTAEQTAEHRAERATPRTEARSTSQGLTVHMKKWPLLLDPHLMVTASSMTITMQLFRGLLRIDANGDVVPDLAESWIESKDRKVYRFILRESYFSNGDRITAKNVVLSFARTFLLGAGIAADIDYIAGAKKFVITKNLDDFGVKAISETEVEFHLSYPSALFLKHMAVADCAVMPFETVDTLHESPKAFSGPYKLDGIVPKGEIEADEVILVKWRDDRLDSRRPPKSLRFIFSDASAIDLALEGRVDTLDNVAVPSDVRSKLEKRGWGDSVTEITWERFVVLNPTLLSLELREFLYSRVNPVDVVKAIDEFGFRPAYGLIPDGFPGELEVGDLPASPERPDYRGPKVELEFDFVAGVEVEEKIADYLKVAWSHPRIKLILNPLPPEARFERFVGKKSQAVLGRKGIDYPDGYSVLTYFKSKYDVNYFFVEEPQIDEAISATVREFDAKKRAQLYKNVQLEILKRRTFVPLVFGSQASGLWSEKVISVPSHPMGLHTVPFETIEMKEL